MIRQIISYLISFKILNKELFLKPKLIKDYSIKILIIDRIFKLMALILKKVKKPNKLKALEYNLFLIILNNFVILNFYHVLYHDYQHF